jgi:hypothetical protein
LWYSISKADADCTYRMNLCLRIVGFIWIRVLLCRCQKLWIHLLAGAVLYRLFTGYLSLSCLGETAISQFDLSNSVLCWIWFTFYTTTRTYIALSFIHRLLAIHKIHKILARWRIAIDTRALPAPLENFWICCMDEHGLFHIPCCWFNKCNMSLLFLVDLFWIQRQIPKCQVRNIKSAILHFFLSCQILNPDVYSWGNNQSSHVVHYDSHDDMNTTRWWMLVRKIVKSKLLRMKLKFQPTEKVCWKSLFNIFLHALLEIKRHSDTWWHYLPFAQGFLQRYDFNVICWYSTRCK